MNAYVKTKSARRDAAALKTAQIKINSLEGQIVLLRRKNQQRKVLLNKGYTESERMCRLHEQEVQHLRGEIAHLVAENTSLGERLRRQAFRADHFENTLKSFLNDGSPVVTAFKVVGGMGAPGEMTVSAALSEAMTSALTKLNLQLAKDWGEAVEPHADRLFAEVMVETPFGLVQLAPVNVPQVELTVIAKLKK